MPRVPWIFWQNNVIAAQDVFSCAAFLRLG